MVTAVAGMVAPTHVVGAFCSLRGLPTSTNRYHSRSQSEKKFSTEDTHPSHAHTMRLALSLRFIPWSANDNLA